MDKKQIIKLAKKDFEKAWIESANLVLKPHADETYPKLRYEIGKSHVLYDTLQQLREAYLRLGFDEMVNPIFIDKSHVHKQFGKEAPAVLDRCFFTAGLPRPDIGIGVEKLTQIEELGVKLDEEKTNNLKEVFRGYKKGTVDGDDLVLEVANGLDVENDIGLRVLEKVFPELYQLEAIAHRDTLRSHMTSGWFISLSEMCKYPKKLPIKAFSIDRCFRREQKEDASHLRTYHSASCVIADEQVSLDSGKAVSEALLEFFGFSKFKFIPDDKKSKYYTPNTQTEVYGYHPKLKQWVEIATFGLYSPIALANYGIDLEVMNLGCGVERIAMVLNEISDIREMVYPQIYKSLSLTDRDLTTMISYNLYPVTDDGVNLMNNLIEVWKDKGNSKSPCEFKVYEGEFLNHDIIVKAIEKEENTNLLGPAATNEIYVYDGNILGIPENYAGDDKLILKTLEDGIATNIEYYKSIAAAYAYKIEEAVLSNENKISLRSTLAKALSDVNLVLNNTAMRFINNENKLIDIRGPIFSTVEMEVK